MHARITEVRARPGKAGELVDTTRDVILPAARDLDGFRGMIGLIDEESGRALAITIWKSEAEMQEVMTSGVNDRLVANIAPLLLAAPTVDHYSVRILDLQPERQEA